MGRFAAFFHSFCVFRDIRRHPFFRNTLARFICHSVPERFKDGFAEIPISDGPKAVFPQGGNAAAAEQGFEFRGPV